jgi:hypothetical protein
VLVLVVPTVLTGLDGKGYGPLVSLFKAEDTEDLVTSFYLLFFIGSILFFLIRLFLTSGMVITGKKVVVRNIARGRVARREEIIDFGARNWDGTSVHPDFPDVTIIRADGVVLSPLALFFGLNDRFHRGEPLAERAERELVAWYLRVPPDHPSVRKALKRNTTISGRYVWVNRRYQRLGGGLLTLFSIVAISPFFVSTLGYLSNARNWRHPDAWLLILAVWAATLWFLLTICRPRLVLKADRMEIVNPLSRKHRLTQADVSGFDADPDPTTPITIRTDGFNLPIYVTRKRRFNTTEGFVERRKKALLALNEWREKPWLTAGPASD